MGLPRAPLKAVISFADVTDRLEKEAIYRKWQQSLEDKALDSYTLFRCDLNNVSIYATEEGSLISFNFDEAGPDFNSRAREYTEQCIYEDDRAKYAAFVNSDTMLAEYYRGHRSDSLEYREKLAGGGVRWLRLSVDLVERPNSTDVEAYLMYEDIDEAKRSELQTKELSETDPLTGLLNRAAFSSRVMSLISASGPDTLSALLMLDIDGFKLVNDVFGHAAGDQALIDIADSLRSIVRRDDLAARLGGDEFLVFLRDIPDEGFAAETAQQMCAAARKAFSMEVQIGGSVGVALSPRDGTDFETLYKKVDSALYYVKGSGKGTHAVYSDAMADEHLQPEGDGGPQGKNKLDKKRRMLIVDDSSLDHALLQNIFKDEFIIEKAKDGASALIRLRHYGSAISVVLLDLMMPGMDGFEVMKMMQQSAEMRSIPVLIVSGDDSRATCLKAIRCGATDFVTKPVDPDLLRIRVHSAVSKAENERLRAKNSLLEVQSEERLRFETALDSTGITFVECDWLKGSFSYYPSISKYLQGSYDSRRLWQILLSDMVADTQTVQRMQRYVHTVAENRDQTDGSITVDLKTPKGVRHRFRMSVRKLTDEYLLTNRLIIMLNDLDFETGGLPSVP